MKHQAAAMIYHVGGPALHHMTFDGPSEIGRTLQEDDADYV